MEVYLDCNATPTDRRVVEAMTRFLLDDYGNAGSRTHSFGSAAQRAIGKAREQLASTLGVVPNDVVFTSGATESTNLAILGLRHYGERNHLRHVVTTQIEHKATLEPIGHLGGRGFEVSLIGCDRSGRVQATDVVAAVRPDTLLVSVMHVNNETGVIQPIEEVADGLGDHACYLHVDAAQSFGKLTGPLRHPRIDLISISGHKFHGPKGIGALVMRPRDFKRPPLEPLCFGGGQERGLRPGTQPVHQIVGLGLAAELAAREEDLRIQACRAFRSRLMDALSPLSPELTGNGSWVLPNTVNLRFPGLDSEAVMIALKGLVAISNGSACTSTSYTASHVLKAMGFSDAEAQEALRFSWCHLTSEPDWTAVVKAIRALNS